MNRKILFTILIICFSFLFSSCFSLFFARQAEKSVVNHTKIVEWTFDQSTPGQQTSRILLWFDIKTYNGIDISEVFSTNQLFHIKSLINVPAGDAEFIFDSGFVRVYNSSTVFYTVKDCHFRYNFEPGKEYYVTQAAELKEKGGIFKDPQYTYYVRIYDYFPVFSNGRINKKQYKKLKNDTESEDFKSRLIASIPIFETDNLTR